MSDRFTEVTRTGYGSRIINSIKGVVVGIILFVASFGLLYWNEGRVDLSKIVKTAIEIDSQTSADASLNKKLVSVSGVVNSDELIGDNLFLKPDKFIAVERKTEMYAWVEKKETRTRTDIGGAETTETTYSYHKSWTERPELSSNFKYPEGHENPPKPLDSYTKKATAATIGIYSFDPQRIDLPNFTKLPLNSQNVELNQEAILASDFYIFIRKSDSGTFESPQIGDLRISYDVLYPNFDGTIFGKLSGNKIEPYVDKDGNRLYRLFVGTREEGIATFRSEYTTLLWILRLVGFLMMWLGLMALFGPISVLLDIFPIFGALSRSLIGVITFLIAFILSIVTIIVSAIVHNLITLIIVLLATIMVIVFFFLRFLRMKKKRVATQIINPPPSVPLQ